MTTTNIIKKIATAALSFMFAFNGAYSCSYNDNKCKESKEASEMSRDEMNTFEELLEDDGQDYKASDKQEEDLSTELTENIDVSETKCIPQQTTKCTSKRDISLVDSCTGVESIIETCKEYQHCKEADEGITECVDNIDCSVYKERGYALIDGKCCAETTNGSKACILESYKTGEFPRGLAWDGSYLWILDTTIDNKVLKFNVAEGKIEEMHETIRGSDLAWDGKKFWMADDNYLYRFNGKFEIVDMIELDPVYCLTGIAFDGSYFYLANSGCGLNETSTESILKMNQIAHIVEIYETPGVAFTGLTWNDPYLWMSEPSSNLILKLDLNANKVDQFPAPGEWVYGIEWQKDDVQTYLWMTNCDKYHDNLLRLEVVEK